MTKLGNFLKDLELKEDEKNKKFKGLNNTRNTWSRIGRHDSFDELGLGESELIDFLNEWISENPYKNIE